LKAFHEILIPSNKNIKPKAEVNLAFEHLSYNSIPITGKIDHINIDEENKTIEIYDFKTGGYHKEKWESHATLYKYALQLGFYKLLLNTSPTYNKYKITKAHILFVSPSSKDLVNNELEGTESELVHDKVYEFNIEDEADLKELLSAVYNHIKTLDFVDKNSPLAVKSDNEKGIKDIKEFCNLVKTS
jgi:ATP-dependent helicase/DNAse subunit B